MIKNRVEHRAPFPWKKYVSEFFGKTPAESIRNWMERDFFNF